MKIVNNESELRQAYFLRCTSTGQFLLGARDIKGMRLASFCMVAYENNDPNIGEGFLKPIAFHQPFWWEVMAVFSGVELGPNLLGSLSGKASHGSVINTSTDELEL